MIPTKLGRGSIGVNDFGLWLTGLGKSMSGGGIRCFETSISNESSRDLSPSNSGSGDELLAMGQGSIKKYSISLFLSQAKINIINLLTQPDPCFSSIQSLIILFKWFYTQQYHFKSYSQMSLLSASQFSAANQAVSLLRAQLQQQNQQQMSKFQLIGIKLKLVEEQTQEIKQNINKYQRQSNSKIDTFQSFTKKAFKDLQESHPKNAGMNQLESQFLELQHCRDRLVKSSKNLSKQLAQRIESEIDDLQKKNRDQSKCLENELRKQIDLTRNKIRQNEQLMDPSEALEKIEEISNKISREISKVKNKRIERKQNFLNLLETIVIKCKQDATQE